MGSSISQEDMSTAANTVEEIIKNNKVAVFSKTYCPYCHKAKKLLEGLNAKAFVIELDNEKNGAAMQQYLLEKSGQRTVPNIFIDGKHIGGCSELTALHSQDGLEPLLAQL